MATAHYGFRIPALTDQPNGPAQIQALGDDVDAALWAADVGDAGVSTTGITITAATGWGSISYSQNRKNGFLAITISATRTGAAVTPNSGGNVTPDILVATIAAGSRPLFIQFGNFVATTTSGGVYLDVDGTWNITDAPPGATISTGDVVRSTFVYPV